MLIPTEGKVLLEFGASWCPPCRALAPTLDRLEKEGVKVLRVDVDQHPLIAGEYDVMSVPVCFILRNGRHVQTFAGASQCQYSILKDAYDAVPDTDKEKAEKEKADGPSGRSESPSKGTGRKEK